MTKPKNTHTKNTEDRSTYTETFNIRIGKGLGPARKVLRPIKQPQQTNSPKKIPG